MYTNKLLIIALYLILGYSCIWMFNHGYPWMSMLFGFIIIVITSHRIENKLKK
jgi:Kef-type K+ transport system membrane component KefB